MALLAELREQGVRVSADGETLTAGPRAVLTDGVRTTIRMHKAAIFRELAAEAMDREKAIAAARDAAPLAGYRAALILGRLHLCGNCSRYTFGQDPAGAGACSKHGDGLLAFAMPFDCRDFAVSAIPTAPAYLPEPPIP
jgi:hypothetical protein